MLFTIDFIRWHLRDFQQELMVLVFQSRLQDGGDPTIDVTTGEVVSVESIINTSGIKMAIKQYLIDNDLILNSDVNFYISPEDDDGVAYLC